MDNKDYEREGLGGVFRGHTQQGAVTVHRCTRVASQG